MYGKTLKELNTKFLVRKYFLSNIIYEKICNQNEFSYFRLQLNPNLNYIIKNKKFFLLVNKGSVLINKKNHIDSFKEILFCEGFLSLKCIEKTELYIFFFKNVSNIKIKESKKKNFSKIKTSKIKTKKKYWGAIYDIIQNKSGAIKIIEMKANTQSSMEFHIIKKENYFLENGLMNLGIRHSRGINGVIKLKKNNSFLMKPGTMHMRMAKKKCKIVEMSTRDYDNDSIIVHDGKKYKFKIN